MQQVRGDAAAVAEPGGQVAAAGAKGE